MITIDGNDIAQPQGVKEGKRHESTTRRAIRGRPKKHRGKQKRTVTLVWEWLTGAQYRQLMDLFSSGNEVAYVNDITSYGGVNSFSGLPDVEENPYKKPGVRKALQVTINES